jgi:hypothetical protein|tara:strand:+ start:42 stop:782 length:741 start_codon:yes stop_codon:yes gene_type:complete
MSALGKKILDELGDTAIRWLESVGKKVEKQKFAPLPIEKMAEELGQNIVGLEAKAPEFFNIFEALNLYKNLSSGDLILTKPDTFRDLAAKLPDDLDEIYGPQMMDESYKKIEDLADQIKSGIQLRYIPYLEYESLFPNIFQIAGHQGRHRNRALKKAGYNKSLVNFAPKTQEDRELLKLSQKQPLKIELGLPIIRQDPKIFDEMADLMWDKNKIRSDNKEIGTLGELMEIVNVPSYKQFGALRNLK